MKKGEFLRLKIEGKKEDGSIQWAVGLFFVLFLAILLYVDIQVSHFHTSSLYLEDALAASNLASAVIDVEEYGISHIVRIVNPAEAYKLYQNAVKENLGLDENWECKNVALISGQVIVECYIVYNVEEEIVRSYHISKNGQIRMEQGVLGKVSAPNGLLVENTGIYSEISFPVKGPWGINVIAHKGKLVDIVAQSENTEGRETE